MRVVSFSFYFHNYCSLSIRLFLRFAQSNLRKQKSNSCSFHFVSFEFAKTKSHSCSFASLIRVREAISYSCSLRFAAFEFVKSISLACSFGFRLIRVCENNSTRLFLRFAQSNLRKEKTSRSQTSQHRAVKKSTRCSCLRSVRGNCNLRLRALPVEKGSACHSLRLHEFQ